MKKLKLILAFTILFGSLFAQPVAAPSCPTQSIYAHNGTIINGHTLPNGPPTVVLNNLPAGAGGLAIGPSFAFPAPNPTWWTTSGGNYWYYNNLGTWSNTGHSTGNGAAVNLGGGSTKIYNMVGASGQIYVYNGAGPGVLLNTLVPAFGGGGPYDIVCDLADNFYVLRAVNQQGIYCYNPAGVLTCSWSITGMISQTAGGGFAILTTPSPTVHRMYYNSNGTDYIGNIYPGNSTIISTVQALPGGGDYACCALPIPTGSIIAPQGGTLTCNLPQIPLVAQVLGMGSLGWMGGYNTPTTAPISPTCGSIIWSGPGIVSGQNTPTINVNQPGVYSFTVSGCGGCPSYSIIASFTVIGMGGLLVPTITAPLCFGGPSTMSVSPNTNTNTVLWSGPGIVGPNNTFTINFNQPGTYTAVVSSGTNCSGTATVYVSPQPTITAVSNPTIICNGGSATLTAGGAGTGGTYTWNPGAVVGATMVVTPTITTVYTVAATTSVGCAGTQTVLLTVGITPTIIATPNPSAICFGNSSNVTLNGAVTYTTNPGNINGNNFMVNPTVTTSYSILGASVDGCTNTANFQIVVNPLPTVTANNFTICSGVPLNLVSNGAATYAWTGPQGFTSLLQNPVIPNAQPNMTGQYFVIGTSVGGCTGTAVSDVSVIPVAQPSITANTPCFGGTLNLMGSGGATYTWSGPNGFMSNLQNPTINTVSLLNAGSYTLVASIGFCTNFAVYDVTVNPLPAPILTSNAPVCEKQNITIMGPGGLTYQWTGPNNFIGSGNNLALVNVNMGNVGTYVATVTDMNGCVGTGSIAITVNPLPIIGTLGSTVCANTTISFWAAGGTVYEWTGPQGFTASTPTVFIPNATLGMMGQYSVTVTDANNCKNTAVAQVSVNPNPTVTASYDGPICAGKNIKLNASAANALLYYWHGPLNFLSVLQNPPVNNLQIDASGIYTVFVHDAIGCEGTGYINVVVRPLPVSNIAVDKLSSCVPLCLNTAWQSNNQIVSSKWYFNGDVAMGNTASYCFNSAGHYLIQNEFVDNYGCVNTSTIAVDAWPFPIADFNFTPSSPIIYQDIEFADASREADIAEWTWSFSHLKSNTVINKPVVNMNYTDAGSYVAVLIVSSDHGCKDTVIKAIVVGDDYGIYVPDAFSPNGDGTNDIFQPKGFGITQYEMNIFDRWGEKLFTTTDFIQGWNGTYAKRSDDVVKQDVYVWKIKFTNNQGKVKEMSGKVSLIK